MVTKNYSFDIFFPQRIIPVIAIQKSELANPLADALLEGGLSCAEITFRTAAAKSVIKILAERGDMLVGAGTVLNVDQAKDAIDAGASFIVSPGFNSKVVEYCLKQSFPIAPGIATPTDIEQAIEFGLKVVKFFPAEAFGGIKTLNAISAPYSTMKYIPTGGINPENARKYLAHPRVIAVGGSWMASSTLIAKQQFKTIVQLTKEVVDLLDSVNNG